MEVTLYGGTGFIGRAFQERNATQSDLFNDTITLVPRWSRRPSMTGDILYLISTTHNYNVFEDPTLDVKTNLVVLTETLESWRKFNPEGTFNFVSSWFVYGNEYDHSRLAAEGDECNPRGFYSITKRCAEQLVISYAETFNLNYRIFRLSNVLGKSDTTVSAKKNALQYLVNEMKAGNQIDLYEGGEFFRNYISVNDCCDAMYHLMTRSPVNEIYNVGAHNVEFKYIIDQIANRISYDKSKINNIPQKDFHKKVQAKSFIMNTDKLRSTGWKPNMSLTETIDSIL